MARYSELKQKQRSLREAFPAAHALRVHRALSWLGRAEAAADDDDVRFILLWIGFNAAYADSIGDEQLDGRSAFEAFFTALCRLDAGRRIYGLVWERFSQEIRVLLSNQYVFSPFWRFQNGDASCGDWERRLQYSRMQAGSAIARQNTPKVLSIVFDRLYVLRNQLVHGGATWNSSVNRSQVRDGARILGHLLPVFIDLMMDHPDQDWGRPYYPVVDQDLPLRSTGARAPAGMDASSAPRR